MDTNNELNPKGQLTEYCQKRGMMAPTYASERSGPDNAPSWKVTVTWGTDSSHKTEPVSGSKKQAEQEAARQALAVMEAEDQETSDQETENRRMAMKEGHGHVEKTEQASEAFVSGGFASGSLEPQKFDEALAERTETTSTIDASSSMPHRESLEPITVPIDLVTTALGIANHRWTELKRDQERTRGRHQGGTQTDAQYAKAVAQLAMELVREVDAAAKRDGAEIKFVQSERTD